MKRLHLARGDEGAELARAAMRDGDRLEALPEPSSCVDRGAGDAGGVGADAEELVHLVFEADVVIVW